MFDVIKRWFHTYFSEPQAVILLFLLLGSFLIVLTMGNILLPVFIALAFSYLLNGIVNRIERAKLPRWFAVAIVLVLFITIVSIAAVIVMPLLWSQLVGLIKDFPEMVASGQLLIEELTKAYPAASNWIQDQGWINKLSDQVASMSQTVITKLLGSLPGVAAAMVYTILVPIMIFFFLKDKDMIMNYLKNHLPRDRTAASQVWQEMDVQMSNYLRGKVVEIIIVATVTYITFAFMGLDYALILGVITGLSVLIPYLGAAFVTVPVALAALFQWGVDYQTLYIVFAYGFIQALDGNVLAPLLFSEVVNLHPVAIILAVLVFGGIWGFWGVFFAIPLATLVKAVITAWPRAKVAL